MEPSFWRARWREGRIGFHEGAPNRHLARHASVFDGARRVLVPLCGKTADLAFLASRGHSAVGVELVEDAARAFFEEQAIPFRRTTHGSHASYEGGGVEIVVADFFDVGRGELGAFDACFDRAALVALPAADGPRYVAHVRSLLDPGARVLLVTFVHDAPPTDPPFSVAAPEVRALWDGAVVAPLEDVEGDITASLRERGASRLREEVWRIELPA